MTVKREAAVRPMLVSLAVPLTEPAAGSSAPPMGLLKTEAHDVPQGIVIRNVRMRCEGDWLVCVPRSGRVLGSGACLRRGSSRYGHRVPGPLEIPPDRFVKLDGVRLHYLDWAA